MMVTIRLLVIAGLGIAVPFALAQDSGDAKQKVKTIRQLSKDGSSAIPKIAESLKDPATEVRLEAVKALTGIGTQYSLDPLMAATRDNDPGVQQAAVEGLTNFYLPGYIQGRFRRLGAAVEGRWTDTNDQVIPAFVQPREDVVKAVGTVARSSPSMTTRAAAARAVGVLRGKAAIPDLLAGLKSKDDALMYESIIALQKIGDASVAPTVSVYMRDFSEQIQVAAIETIGLMRYKPALTRLQRIYADPRGDKVRRAALGAIAMIPDESSRPIFTRALSDKDDNVRAAAAEGFARLKNPADLATVDRAFNNERKAGPRLAMAFALVSLGKTELSEFSPLQYLINTLNSRARQGIAEPYLVELARTPMVREQIYAFLPQASKDEKIGLARVLGASGDKQSEPKLEALSKDSDGEVAEAGLEALRTLRMRTL